MKIIKKCAGEINASVAVLNVVMVCVEYVVIDRKGITNVFETSIPKFWVVLPIVSQRVR